MKFLIIFLLILIPASAFAYNSGFQPVYQPTSLSGGSPPEEKYCGNYLQNYNSTTNSFDCGNSSIFELENVTATACNNLEVLQMNSTGFFECVILSGSGEANTASSSGLGYSLVLPKSGVDLPFRGIFCAGDLLCSSNSTDVRISYIDTPGGSGNATSLDDLGDVVLTAPANFSILFYNGVQWLDQIFKSNTITCSAGQFFSAFDNSTGTYTCGSPTGSGFTKIVQLPPGTATILNSNSSNTAEVKSLTQGTGIAITNGSSTVTIASSIKTNTTTCSGTDKFSAYSNTTGTFTCSTDSTGSGGAPRGGYLVAHWTQSTTKTNIGTAFVNIYTQTNSNGKAILIDTDTFTTARLYVQWNKIGAGTQTCQIISGANVLVSTDVVSGANDSGFDAIPAGLLNAENAFRIQCKSTTAADDPVFESASVWIK